MAFRIPNSVSELLQRTFFTGSRTLRQDGSNSVSGYHSFIHLQKVLKVQFIYIVSRAARSRPFFHRYQLRAAMTVDESCFQEPISDYGLLDSFTGFCYEIE
ncbi:hypothetical protein AVEN_265519-1 [Araneus ventricosus]|uniref:Uncharacterized protein n=1 Tax=Araneus ventricosus TaxID=182803 RepID=A0A4Y2LDB4_ARAVE|nr:hypothetical protein AVEN_265519-1 [Araneus ventricosus]